MSAQFPDVPDDPGVPPVNRDASNADPANGPTTVSEVTVTASPRQIGWGIFDQDGNAVIVGDSFVSFAYSNEWNVPNYPIEEGGFQSYNKVQLPFDAKITLSKGGDLAARTDFLNAIQDVIETINLYSVVTPEMTFHNCNLVHQDYERRSDRGVTLLMVSIYFKQIRQDAAAAFSNTQQPTGANTVNSGAVQPKTPSSVPAGVG